MAVPTTLTDIVTLVAVLLGSIAAGIMFMRPPRSGRGVGRTRRRVDAPEAATERPAGSARSLPPMLGGDIFTGAEAHSPPPPSEAQTTAPPAVGARRRRWPSTSRTEPWSTTSPRRPW